MSTDQTIDGVPRSTIEDALAVVTTHNTSNWSGELRDKLRALLTAADGQAERSDQQSLALLEVEAACDLAMSAMDDDERGANFVQIISAIKAKAELKPARIPRSQRESLACATIRVERLDSRLCATVARFDIRQLPVGSLTNVYAVKDSQSMHAKLVGEVSE